MIPTRLPKFVLVLGPAGLLPQVLALLLLVLWPEGRWFALTSSTLYAAAILSFLGGLWWMQALASGSGDGVPYVIGFIPALLAWLVPLSWAVSLRWPGPELMILGMALIGSPLVDRYLARYAALPPGWIRMRWLLAGGLGGLTLVIGLLT